MVQPQIQPSEPLRNAGSQASAAMAVELTEEVQQSSEAAPVPMRVIRVRQRSREPSWEIHRNDTY